MWRESRRARGERKRRADRGYPRKGTLSAGSGRTLSGGRFYAPPLKWKGFASIRKKIERVARDATFSYTRRCMDLQRHNVIIQKISIGFYLILGVSAGASLMGKPGIQPFFTLFNFPVAYLKNKEYKTYSIVQITVSYGCSSKRTQLFS
ncbi:hypothetical protein KL86DPRO_11456 [uncultured delta proteobacterium]|uniref:Uncharacterized protein n=1 Tax=uncultured delta proteobacterium TaxID=34034 RepID=A0A212JHF1_9DELT|nr:hypothetical protein KL86DPRO_11456 [uncultured delta proteobacterium]